MTSFRYRRAILYSFCFNQQQIHDITNLDFLIVFFSAVLIAVYEGENQVSADVRNAVEKLTTYLESIGY